MTAPQTAYTLGGPKSLETLPPCPKCGGTVDVTTDAIGRTRERCRRCDGVAKQPFVRPGEIRRTQTEPEYPRRPETVGSVALPPGVYRLPEIEAGQLRCQRCARGVVGTRRICRECLVEARHARRKEKPEAPAKLCPECGIVPLLRRAGKFGRPPTRCVDCQAKKDLGPMPRCKDCKGEAPRGHLKCDACRAKTAERHKRKCSRCGSTDVAPWKQLCAPCRSARPVVDASSDAVTGTGRYANKQCKRCFRPFTPTGPRSLYCKRPECS